MKLIPDNRPPMPKGYKLESQIRQSYAGQAYFAGTGPVGTFCGTCTWYVRDERWQMSCEKFRQLTSRIPQPIPRDAKSCKYYNGKLPTKAVVKTIDGDPFKLPGSHD